MTQRKLRMGMVGGGPGAFIGPVHRIAAELDGKIELVAGAFSQSADRSKAAADMYKIDPDRAYPDYKAMMEAERKRADRIDFGGTICLAIATAHEVASRRSRIVGGREWVRLGAVEMGLDCLRRYLQGLPVHERIDFEKIDDKP